MADHPTRLRHTDKSFSVKVIGWNSPRPHSRSGLWGNEVVFNVDGQRTYNLVKIDRQAFFVLPYAGEDYPKAISAFLSQMLDIHATVAGGNGMSVQLPLVDNVYDIKPETPSQTELLNGFQELQSRLRHPVASPPSEFAHTATPLVEGAEVDHSFAKYQAKNQYLLIAALVLHKMNVEEAFKSLIGFAEGYPEEERRLFRSLGGVGGWEARKVEAVLHGHYYDTDTVLYLVRSSPVPFIVAGNVKRAYDLTICSHLNDDLDLGEKYSNTTYYRLLTDLDILGTNGVSSLALIAPELPFDVQNVIYSAPSTLASDAEKAAWLYSLEDPPVYQTINRALFNDKEKDLKLWMPLILLIKRYAITHPIQEDIITYRSSGMTKAQFDALRMHAVYRDPKFVSTSKSEEFVNVLALVHERDYKCEFKIRENCTNAVMLPDSVSEYKEHEILLPPYSPLLVIGKDDKKKLVQFAVLGDEAAQKHLEGPGGRHCDGLPWGTA